MPSAKDTDTYIIAHVLRGDKQSYALLVERYQAYVFTLAFRILKNREDAEEAAQDCFVKAFRNLADFRNDSKFSTWLYTIVHHGCLDRLRKHKIQLYALGTEDSTDKIDLIHSEPASDLTERKHTLQTVNKAIAALKPEDAAVITLFYMHEQKLEEIARITGVDVNTAKVRLHRARQRLRVVIETKYVDDLSL